MKKIFFSQAFFFFENKFFFQQLTEAGEKMETKKENS